MADQNLIVKENDCAYRDCFPGAFGHVNPTLAFVTELIKRGVRVTYFTPESFRAIIEPTGARFVPVPSWMESGDSHGGDSGQEENVAATVPFLFLKEAGRTSTPCWRPCGRISRTP